MKTIKALLAMVCCSCALYSGGATAQTISQPAGPTPLSGFGMGQSFTATLTGNVTAISVSPVTSPSTSLHLYQGDAGSGILSDVGTPAYSQPVTLAATAPGVFQRIDLATPFPVVAGATYTFVVDGISNLRMSPSDAYPDGTRISLFSAQINAQDLAFEIYEVAAVPVSSPASIPSSSEWSLIGASLLVLAAALFHRRRSRTRQRG